MHWIEEHFDQQKSLDRCLLTLLIIPSALFMTMDIIFTKQQYLFYFPNFFIASF